MERNNRIVGGKGGKDTPVSYVDMCACGDASRHLNATCSRDPF